MLTVFLTVPYISVLGSKPDAALASDNNMVTVFLYREPFKQNEA